MPAWPAGDNSAAAARCGGASNRPAAQGPVVEPRIGRVGDRLGLHGRVDHHPFEIAARQHPALALPPGSPAPAQRARPRRAAAANMSATSGRTAAGGRSPIRHRRTGNTGSPTGVRTAPRPTGCACASKSAAPPPAELATAAAIARCAHARTAPVEKPPIDLTRQPHQRMAEVDDVLATGPAAEHLVALPPCAPMPMTRPHCQKPESQTLLSRKIDYCRGAGPPSPINRLRVLHGRLLNHRHRP